jgi:small redox-active disulfide protein 2
LTVDGLLVILPNRKQSYQEAWMKIQILGSGCAKCRQLEANAREAVAAGNVPATVEKVTDLDAIMNMGVMMTPALAVDGVVRSAGKVLSKEEIVGILGGGK